MKNIFISDQELAIVPWLQFPASLQILQKYAKSELSIEFSIENFNSIKTDINEAKTKNILPSKCAHLQKLFDKYIKSQSDSENKLKYDFMIELELEKTQNKIDKLQAKLVAIKTKSTLELSHFIQAFSPSNLNPLFQLPPSWNPETKAIVDKIYSNMKDNFKAQCIHRQYQHKLKKEEAASKKAQQAQDQNQILTFTKSDFEKEVKRILRLKNSRASPPKPRFSKNAPVRFGTRDTQIGNRPVARPVLHTSTNRMTPRTRPDHQRPVQQRQSSTRKRSNNTRSSTSLSKRRFINALSVEQRRNGHPNRS